MVQSKPALRLLEKLARFQQLPLSRRVLLCRVSMLVATVRLGLWIVPFRRLEHMLTTLNHRLPRPNTPSRWTPDELGWAVRAAAAELPQASCLTQALAAQWLLNRHGYATELHIGFAKAGTTANAVAGHAWLECQGRILTGDGPLTHFSRLTTWHR